MHPELKLSEALSFSVRKKILWWIISNWVMLFVVVVVVIGNFLFFESNSIEKRTSLEKSQLKSFLSILLKHMSNYPGVNMVIHMLQIGIKHPEELLPK